MSSAKKIKTTYTYNNKAVLIRGGKEYFDQLKMLIRQAKAFIQLQVYIFEDDHTGNEIKECLIAAAKRSRPRASRVIAGSTKNPTIAVIESTNTEVGSRRFIRR